MDKTDFLFKTHLNYQILSKSEEDKSQDISQDNDLEGIDLHHCTFADFKKALNFTRNNYTDYYFNDSTLENIKPTDFEESKPYDFIALSDYAKHTAISIGNMTLFSELQKISSAAELFNVNNSAQGEQTNTFALDKMLADEASQSTTAYEELGSCVIGGGSVESYKLTAMFHDSTRRERPIVTVRSYSINNDSYLPNIDIIDISTIYKPNATLMETFAYMSYEDYRKKNDFSSFDRLLISGDIDIDSMDDMYNQHYDLRIYDRM